MFTQQLRIIEINPTELCNLKCNFCPRSTFYPNQNLNMSLDTAREIARQLKSIEYKHELSITGRGEPTLHPQFEELCNIFMEDRTWTLKINTNTKRFDRYYDTIMQFDRVIYNLYEHDEIEWQDHYLRFLDHPNVIVKSKPKEMSWTDKATFTNRAGSFPTNQTPQDGRCEVIFIKMFIDYDGTYRVCCEDWKDKISLGNIFDTEIEDYIENNEELKSYRRTLIKGNRCKVPCINCTHMIEHNKYKSSSDEKWKELEWLVKKENHGV